MCAHAHLVYHSFSLRNNGHEIKLKPAKPGLAGIIEAKLTTCIPVFGRSTYKVLVWLDFANILCKHIKTIYI